MALRHRTRRTLAAAGAALVAGAILTAAPTARAGAAAGTDALLNAHCLDATVPLSVEQRRLNLTLPSDTDPSHLASTSLAAEMIAGGGFEQFGPSFVDGLCQAGDLVQAEQWTRQRGEQLWRMAVDRAQRHGPAEGTLPYSDDRPLYWTRLQAMAAIRQWVANFSLLSADRAALITAFDRASRGMFDIGFPAGAKRIVVSGFDPYTLDGGPNGTAPSAAGNNIRHGNPSGATVLALDGTRAVGPDGVPEAFEAYLLPVNYTEFEGGYQEDTLAPLMRPGPTALSASITMSQGGGSVFDLEQWNSRYHGTSAGNDNSLPCPTRNGEPQLPASTPRCDIGAGNSPQWTTTTLPIAQMITARTGAFVARPPGDEWPDPSLAFGVVWRTSYTEFPSCTSSTLVTRNVPVPATFPPPAQPTPPDPGSCAYSGGGGNYLSNESAYRNTLLRDRFRLTIPAGHIHTPDMQRFAGLYDVSDSTVDGWRLSIVAQALHLVHVVADSAPSPTRSGAGSVVLH